MPFNSSLLLNEGTNIKRFEKAKKIKAMLDKINKLSGIIGLFKPTIKARKKTKIIWNKMTNPSIA